MCLYCEMLAKAGANASAQLHHHLIMKAKAEVAISVPLISAQDYSSLLQTLPQSWLRKAVAERAAEIYDKEGWDGFEKWVKETGLGSTPDYEKAYRKD